MSNVAKQFNFRTCAVSLSACLVAALVLPTAVHADPVSQKPAALNVVASGFANGGVIPKQFTADGADQSPPLAWSSLPADTKSVAIFCQDPDAPAGTWCHWIAFNFSPKTRRVPQGVPQTDKLPGGAMQATNDFKRIGYNGPAPPKGKTHRYYFHVYALGKRLTLSSAATQADFRKAIAGNILAEGFVMGTYQR